MIAMYVWISTPFCFNGVRQNVAFVGFTFGLRAGDINATDRAPKDLELCMESVTTIDLSARLG